MKVKLRKLSMNDAERVFEIFANDKVIKNLLVELKAKEITLNQEKGFIKKSIKNYRNKKPKDFDLAIIVNNKLIGIIGAKSIDYKNKKTEIGYWISELHWGEGYATQAIKEFDKFLRRNFKLVRIEAFPFSYNKPSQRVLEKAGFKFEGERKKSIYKKGKFLDDRIYARTK